MKLIITPRVEKQVLKLPKNQRERITKKLRLLEKYPYSGKLLTGDMHEHYSLKAWPYRIIYKIVKEQKLLLVNSIEHRQGVYKYP